MRGMSEDSKKFLCFYPINQIFSKVPEKNSSQRLFFNKFQRQFKNEDAQRFIDQVSGNVYIQNGSYEQAKNCYQKIDQTSPSDLTKFVLGFINLMETTNRNNPRKLDTFNQAVDYFDAVKLSRPQCTGENFYNAGRFFTHLNMPTEAIQAYAQGLTECEGKLIDLEIFGRGKAEIVGRLGEMVKAKEKYYESALNLFVWNNSIGNYRGCDEIVENYLSFDVL